MPSPMKNRRYDAQQFEYLDIEVNMQRRHFLQAATLLSPALLPSQLLAAANGQLPAVTRGLSDKRYPFALGVASGSPLADGVVLWTRIIPDPLNTASSGTLALSLRWEVAEDEAFRQIVAKGNTNALPQLGHSVHVEVTGLRPGRWYWYRFLFADAVSPIGRTRTAPARDSMPASLKMAVASCQHWEFGTYCAHQAIAAANPDLVAFLGDYIYEWGPYALSHPATAGRSDESFTLDDYRRRYAQYKSDRQLQAAHHCAPWVMTWDDHEVANDYANLIDERLDKNFAARRAAAYQAYYEHMPLRISQGLQFANFKLFQRLEWGQLANLHILDNRQYRAAEACPKPGQGGSNSVTASCKERLDPKRSMLGREQESWLEHGFATSRTRWNLLLQQTLMAQNSQIPSAAPGGGRFWTDGWDGYPASRERLLQAMRKHKLSNPVVLSGDVHTFYASNLVPDFNQPVSSSNSGKNPIIATEFCGTSITSTSRPQARTERYMQDNPHTRFGRSDLRGFMLLDIGPERMHTHFIAMQDVKRSDSTSQTLAQFMVEDGVAGVVKT